jgi:hypothetical protein
VLNLFYRFFESTGRRSNGTLGHWGATTPPTITVPDPHTGWNYRHVDPVPGIFQQIAALAATPKLESFRQQSPSPSSESGTEESEAEDANSSGWESEGSDDNMEMEPLPLDMDTGQATFATS